MATQNDIQHEEQINTTYPPTRAASSSSISRRDSLTSITSESESDHADLPAADSSPQAFKFLVASFVVECLVWSFPNAYGVFFNYYINSTALGHAENAQFLLSLAGTCQSGLIYCSAPLVFYMHRRYPQYFQHFIWVGALLHGTSLILTSFANAPYQIVLLQGVMYALGGTLVSWSTFALIPEWFYRRRGLASGVCFAGTSVGGVFLPFLVTVLLEKFGVKTTLRGLGIGCFLLLAPVIPFVRRRVPYTSPKSATYRRPASRRADASTDNIARGIGSATWWKDSLLWCFLLATMAQALGFFITVLYLPNFASSLGLMEIQGTTALAVLNTTGTLSRLGAGILVDYVSPFRVAAISLPLSGLAVFLLWGLASTNFGALLAFSAVFGLSATGFTSLASGVIKDLAGEDASRNVMLFGIIIFTRGLGNVLISPISTALLTDPDVPFGHRPDTIYQTNFSSVVIFSGVTLIIAGIVSVGASLLQNKRKKQE